MALYDWNHNGKKDIVDNYIEYQIYEQTCGDKKRRRIIITEIQPLFHRELHLRQLSFFC